MLIKFGDYNNNYKYIYLMVIFNIFSFFVDNGYITLLLFPDQTEDNKSRPIYLYIHPLIIDNINYLGTFIIAIIIHKIREKKSGVNEQDDKKKNKRK